MSEQLVGVSYRIRRDLKEWLREEAEKAERSSNYMLNKFLDELKQQRQQQPQEMAQ